MNKWLEDKKANLGGVRRPIEREREKLMHTITASGLTTKWINAHTVNNVENVAAATTLQHNVKRKNKR